jgi:hypothetical protein
MVLNMGEPTARKIQLQIEYDPAPPISSPPEIMAACVGGFDV